jgi:TPR repeat protein
VEEQRGNLSEAERWYRQAAEGGHESGTLNLGALLEDRGDVSAAMDLYRRAWELGSDRAAFNLGKIYDDDGKGDVVAAAEWYERAAEWGNGGAAYNLGHVRLDQGDMAAQAAAWQRAADLKHPKAAYSLGVMFKRKGDEESAVTWLRRSVEEFGDTAAADMLADLHERHGDRDQARFWREFPRGLSAYSPQFEAFASEASAAAIHRQDLLNKMQRDGNVQFNIDERTLTTGGRAYHGITFLGSFSHLDQSWMWAWANKQFREDLPAIEPLRDVREYGRNHDIAELVIGRLDLSGFANPHQAATTMVIAAAALLGGNGVHSCGINGGKGSAYFHLDDPQLPVAGYDPNSAPRVLMTAIGIFPSDHRRVVRGFIAHYGSGIAEGPDVIQGRFPDGHRLTVAFTPDGLVKGVMSEPARP